MGIFDFLFPKKKTYDLETLEGIQSIEIPSYKPLKGMESPIENIEYILQRKATEHKRNGRMDLAIACLRKSNEIFPHSNFLWSSKDYFRLVEFLKQDGQFDEARAEESKLNGLFAPKPGWIGEVEMTLLNCKSMKTDLVISSEDNSRLCSECAKFTRRVFSISEKNCRFPSFPEYFKLSLPEHKYCFTSFYPFKEGFSEPGWEYYGTLKGWCNRPFEDERTEQQKRNYKNWVIENEQEIIDRRNFDFIREQLPEIAPKSFGGFRRMKNQRSPTYIRLLSNAGTKGINLDETPDLTIYHF